MNFPQANEKFLNYGTFLDYRRDLTRNIKSALEA